VTFQEIINLHPHPTELDRDLLLRCIEECLDCAASCTACADACLGESDLPELRRCIRRNLDCADACEATGRIVTRHHEHCRVCAAVCRRCKQACDELVVAIG
jgi:hypothetical protein